MTSLLVSVLSELEPVVARELDRHLAAAREWMPHEYVPWSLARDFDGPMGGQAWDVSQSSMSAVVRTALVVNLLTEDNLPSYHREIHRCMGADGAWATWIGRWTAEEGRHGTAIRDYLLVTRAVDPNALERERMIHMTGGYGRDNDPDVFDTLAYVTFQELATRIAHRNTGKQSGDPVCERLLTRIATDENLHMSSIGTCSTRRSSCHPIGPWRRSGARSRASRCRARRSRASAAARCRSRWRGSTTCESTATRC